MLLAESFLSMPHKLPLSIFIITKNEVDRLARTLLAVQALSDDIIVVDSGSTDGTQELAKKLGARVIHNDWIGYGPQKRFCEEQCRYDWMLNIDADEVVPPNLANEIITLFADGEPALDAYKIRIAEIFPGEGEPHPFAYALAPVRLYKKSIGRYSPSIVHDRVDLHVNARIGKLKGTIHHFSIRSIGDQLNKLNSYTDQQIIDLVKNNKSIPTWRLFVEFSAAFFKAYILRRHIVRGVYGFMTAMNFAFYRWLRVAKDVERRRVEVRKDKN
jgi:glycosyltransferase involved in cell wall biosynthesis